MVFLHHWYSCKWDQKNSYFLPHSCFCLPHHSYISIHRILKRKGPIQLKVLNIDFLDCRKLWRPVVLALCTLSYYSTLDSRLQEANQWPNCILCKLRKVTVKCCKCKCHIFMTISLHWELFLMAFVHLVDIKQRTCS